MWTIKGEWLYYAVPNKQVGNNFAGGGATIQYFSIKNTGNIARVSLNYRRQQSSDTKAPGIVLGFFVSS